MSILSSFGRSKKKLNKSSSFTKLRAHKFAVWFSVLKLCLLSCGLAVLCCREVCVAAPCIGDVLLKPVQSCMRVLSPPDFFSSSTTTSSCCPACSSVYAKFDIEKFFFALFYLRNFSFFKIIMVIIGSTKRDKYTVFI